MLFGLYYLFTKGVPTEGLARFNRGRGIRPDEPSAPSHPVPSEDDT